MKKTILLAVVASGLAWPVLAQDTNALTSEQAKVSYAIGLRTGGQLKQVDYDLDMEAVMRGLKDGQSGAHPLMTQQEMMETLQQFSKTIQAKQKDLMAKQAMKGKEEGEAFLATNKNSPGVITLTNGLQYKVVKDGDGPLPKPTDTVTVNYRGTLINGTEFDSSAKQGKPATFPVLGVIKGWTQALEMMKVGSKWQLYVPSELAYGVRGHPPGIPPNTTLIFDIELLGIQAPKPPPAPPVQNPPLTSDIIKVPSQAEMNKGAKIEVIKQEDLQKAQAQSQTNTPPPPQ